MSQTADIGVMMVSKGFLKRKSSGKIACSWSVAHSGTMMNASLKAENKYDSDGLTNCTFRNQLWNTIIAMHLEIRTVSLFYV